MMEPKEENFKLIEERLIDKRIKKSGEEETPDEVAARNYIAKMPNYEQLTLPFIYTQAFNIAKMNNLHVLSILHEMSIAQFGGKNSQWALFTSSKFAIGLFNRWANMRVSKGLSWLSTLHYESSNAHTDDWTMMAYVYEYNPLAPDLGREKNEGPCLRWVDLKKEKDTWINHAVVMLRYRAATAFIKDGIP